MASGLGTAAFGVLLLFGSWAALHDAGQYDELHEAGTRVDADVVDTRETWSGSGSNRTKEYRASVRFTTAEGRPISGETKIDGELFEELAQGRRARIRVSYLPQEPERFRLEALNEEEKGGARGAGWVMRILGALAIVGGIYLTYRAVKRPPLAG